MKLKICLRTKKRNKPISEIIAEQEKKIKDYDKTRKDKHNKN